MPDSTPQPPSRTLRDILAAGAAKAREDARAYFVKAVARAVADKDEKTAEFVRRQMADCGFAAGGN